MAAERESRFFRAWAQLVLRFKFIVVPLILACAALAIYNIRTSLQIETSPEYFAQGSSDAAEILDQFRADFGRDDLYLVLARGDVFTADYLTRLTTLHDALERADIVLDAPLTSYASAPPAAPGPTRADGSGGDWGEEDWGEGEGDDWADEGGGSIIEDVTSLVNFRQTVFEGGGLDVRGLMDTPPTDLDAFRAQVLGDSQIVGAVVGADGRHSVLAVRSVLVNSAESRVLQAGLAELVAQHNAPGFDLVVTGMPALEAAVSSSVMRDMRRLMIVAFVLMAAVLFALFRHPLAVVAPLAVVGLSVMFTLGAMAATGTPVTLLTNIVPAFLICVGLGDSVHVQSVFRDLRVKGVPPQEAVVSAVASTGMPLLFTTLTTMVGLLSFLVASTTGIQELGMFAAWGVLCALVLSITVIPIAMSAVGARHMSAPPRSAGSGGDGHTDFVDRLLRACTDLSKDRAGQRRVFVGAVVLVVIAGVGISKVVVFHDPLTWLPEGHPTQVSILEMDAHVGGASNVVVVVEQDTELGVKDVALLQKLEALDAHVRTFEHPRTGAHIVGNSQSLLDVVYETNRALHEGDPAHYALPAGQRAVSDALLLFESAGPADLRRVATADLKKTHMTFRLHWMDATSLLPLADHVEAGVRKHLGPDALSGDAAGARAQVTGTVYSLVSVVGALIGDMMRSFGAAVVVIAVMMGALLRSGRLAAIALVPNLLPVALVLGFMGFTGIPIDMATLLIASIVIGIAVDDTIHYLHQFRVGYRTSGSVEEGISYSLGHAGRAMVSTTIILALGFSAYTVSSLSNVQRFGILVGTACGAALFTNLILVPAMLRTTHGALRGKT